MQADKRCSVRLPDQLMEWADLAPWYCYRLTTSQAGNPGSNPAAHTKQSGLVAQSCNCVNGDKNIWMQLWSYLCYKHCCGIGWRTISDCWLEGADSTESISATLTMKFKQISVHSVLSSCLVFCIFK